MKVAKIVLGTLICFSGFYAGAASLECEIHGGSLPWNPAKTIKTEIKDGYAVINQYDDQSVFSPYQVMAMVQQGRLKSIRLTNTSTGAGVEAGPQDNDSATHLFVRTTDANFADAVNDVSAGCSITAAK